MQASKSQIRAARLLGIAVDPINDEYPEVAAKLEAAWLPGDGLPGGHTWRSAAKLSDDELVKLLRAEDARRADFAENGHIDGRSFAENY